MVASEARAFHNETYKDVGFRKAIFYGRSGAVLRYHFVRLNDELSTWSYFFVTASIISKNLVMGMFGSKKHFGLFFGGVIGLANCIRCNLGGNNSENMVRELFKYHE